MRLSDIMEAESNGTYVGIRLSPQTEKDVNQYIKDNNIPNDDSLKEWGFHVTIVYSRKVLDDFKPESKSYKATAIGFDLFGDDEDTLVMKLKSPELTKRHEQIRKEHGATHDYDSYEPHITLSYDAAEIDFSQLPSFDKEITLTDEYTQELED